MNKEAGRPEPPDHKLFRSAPKDKTPALIRRNRMLLARAEARERAYEAVITAKRALRMAMLNKVERKRCKGVQSRGEAAQHLDLTAEEVCNTS